MPITTRANNDPKRDRISLCGTIEASKSESKIRVQEAYCSKSEPKLSLAFGLVKRNSLKWRLGILGASSRVAHWARSKGTDDGKSGEFERFTLPV